MRDIESLCASTFGFGQRNAHHRCVGVARPSVPEGVRGGRWRPPLASTRCTGMALVSSPCIVSIAIGPAENLQLSPNCFQRWGGQVRAVALHSLRVELCIDSFFGELYIGVVVGEGAPPTQFACRTVYLHSFVGELYMGVVVGEGAPPTQFVW